MLRACAVLCLAIPLAAQTWDPKMPGSVPAVAGQVIEAATFRYIDVKIGGGDAAKPGEEYTVHYTGWLRDGTKFDSSIGKQPLKFVQGRRQVIAGWEMGFEGMRVGGQRRLFIPYQLAYGEQGRGSIPPKAELIFDVELLATAPAPPANAAGDILFSLASVESETMQLAKAMPEEKYAWKPGPGVRTFQQVMLHIARGNHLILGIARGADPDEVQKIIAENDRLEQTPIDKASAIKALEESFAEIHQYLDSLRATQLTFDMEFFGQKTTRRGIRSGWTPTWASIWARQSPMRG